MPSAPSKPRAVELALNNTIILLWWQPGAKTISSTINRYQLEHRHSTQTKWQLTRDFPLELSFCFLSLQVGISYWFRVKALSQTGSSNWSETSDRIYMTKSNGCHQLPKDDCSLKDQTGKLVLTTIGRITILNFTMQDETARQIIADTYVPRIAFHMGTVMTTTYCFTMCS